MNESNRFQFECVQTIGRLALFKIIPRTHLTADNSPAQKATVGLNSGSELYALTRIALKNEQYANADTLLRTLRVRYKHAAVFTGDLQYQQLILHTFILDSIRAMHDLQQLYSLSTASSFIDPANLHIQTMNLLLEARRTPSAEQRALLLFSAGRFCWSFGYPHQALRLLQESVQQSPTYFEGTLWAWHVALQLGQQQQAAKYLHQLDAIDSKNVLVQSFHRISLLQDSLQHGHASLKRSSFYASLANEYASIDLPDEAFDAANNALAEDSTNANAANLLLALFEKRHCTLAAEKIRRQYHSLLQQ